MKVIIDTPKGQYLLSLIIIASKRAEFYSDIDDDDYIEHVDFVMKESYYEGIFWLIKNTKFEDWEDYTIKLNDDVKISEDEFWCSSTGFNIVEEYDI